MEKKELSSVLSLFSTRSAVVTPIVETNLHAIVSATGFSVPAQRYYIQPVMSVVHIGKLHC